jgi:uncharacterized protein YegP (UPF0339 family)
MFEIKQVKNGQYYFVLTDARKKPLMEGFCYPTRVEVEEIVSFIQEHGNKTKYYTQVKVDPLQPRTYHQFTFCNEDGVMLAQSAPLADDNAVQTAILATQTRVLELKNA